MANTSSAKKAARKIEARTEVNKSRRSRMRTFIPQRSRKPLPAAT